MNKRIKKKMQKRFRPMWEIYIIEGKCYHALVITDSYKKFPKIVSAYKIEGLESIAYNPPNIGCIWVGVPAPKFFNTLPKNKFVKISIDEFLHTFDVNIPSYDELVAKGYIMDNSVFDLVDAWTEEIVKAYEKG